jgi:hypothetical protein
MIADLSKQLFGHMQSALDAKLLGYVQATDN